MILRVWKHVVSAVLAAYVRGVCRRMMRKNGFTLATSAESWKCSQCGERIEDVQRPRYVHTFAGETFKHPLMVATMCARCAWVADGTVKVPIWKWLKLRGANTPHRDFFLRNQQKSLRLALSEIEQELKPRELLKIDSRRLQRRLRELGKMNDS